MRASKDIARRLRLAGYPGRDAFRTRYLAAVLVCAVAGFGCWLVMQSSFGPRQYLPRPVSANHAMFGERCESCHDSFASVPDAACLGCHSQRVHSTHESATPSCAHCHAEHRSTDVFLSVSERACIGCHASLHASGKDPAVATDVASFASHPEFDVLRGEHRDHDPGRIRFNHRVHLTSSQIPENERPLECAKCHRLDARGARMQPIRFATDCQRCHRQVVDGPTGSIEALHDRPEVVREDLRRQLLDAAASIGTVTSEELRKQLDKLATPSPELLFPQNLPGRVARPGFSKERLSVRALELDLYRAFLEPGADGSPKTAALYELNKNCFLCHYGHAAADENELAVIEPTAIPAHWLARAEFSHVRHEKMPCESCHPGIAESRDTAQTNLPDKAVCQKCHVDGGRASAGTVCMSCHLYHDTSKARASGIDAGCADNAECAGTAGCADNADCRKVKDAVLPPIRRQVWWNGAGEHAADLPR